MGCGGSKATLSTEGVSVPPKQRADPGLAASRSLFVTRVGKSEDSPIQVIRDRWMYLVANLYAEKIEFIYEDRFSYEVLIQFPVVHAVLINGVFLCADGRSPELRILSDTNRSIRMDSTITALAAHPHEVNTVLIGTGKGELWKFPFVSESSRASFIQQFPSPIVKVEEATVSLLSGQTQRLDALRPTTVSPVVGRFPTARNFRFLKLYENPDVVKFLGRAEPRIKEPVAAGFAVADRKSLHVVVASAGGAVSRDLGEGVRISESENLSCVYLSERQLFLGGERGSLVSGLCAVDKGRLQFNPSRSTSLAMTQAVHEDAEIKCMQYINDLLVVLDKSGGLSVSSLTPGEADSVVVFARTYIKYFQIVSDEFMYILSASTLDKHLLVDMSLVENLCTFSQSLNTAVVLALHIPSSSELGCKAIICTDAKIQAFPSSSASTVDLCTFAPNQRAIQCEFFTLSVQIEPSKPHSAEMRSFCAVLFDTGRLHVYLLSSISTTDDTPCSLLQVANLETTSQWILPEALLLTSMSSQGGSVHPLLRAQEADLEQQSLLQTEAVKRWILDDAEAIAERVKPPPPLVEELVGNAKQWIKSALDDKADPKDDPAKKATKAILQPLKVGAKGLKLVGEGVLSKVTEATTQIIKNVETLTQIQDASEQMEHEAADFARLAKQLEQKF